MASVSAHRPLIVGTAGHIDHGKTSLIKLLTGEDTDRLKQEKERGITIELGFASMKLPSGTDLGVIDVPGHERFIKNMLAGAGGIDLILFVIAADEGVMPQTREHMDIINLLGVERGVVALTKIDMVDPDFVEMVEETVAEYLQETCLAGAPIVRVSATTGEGKKNVFKALDDIAAGIQVGERGHLRRLPIDRVFTMEGFGTVVTGTLWSGHLQEGEAVRIMPTGETTRIKALEVHNDRVERALAGQRVAVSLHAVDKAAISRGDWVLAGEGPEPTRLVDVKLRVLASAAKPLANSTRIRFHLGATEAIGRLILLDQNEILPGKSGWAQLRLEEKVICERGDRFVLRTYSPMATVAGGNVVTAGVGKRRRFREEDLQALAQAEKGTPSERVLAVLIRHGALCCDRPTLAKESGCTNDEVEAALAELIAEEKTVAVSKRMLTAVGSKRQAGERMRGILEGYQRGNPLSWGILKSELKKRLESTVHADLVEAWVSGESEGARIFARNDRLRYGSDQFDLSPEHDTLRRAIKGQIDTAAFSGCAQKEVIEAQSVTGSRLGMAKDDVLKDTEALLVLLVDSGDIGRVPPHFYFSQSLLIQLAERVRGYFESNDEMRVGDFKNLISVSRKQAVPLLEYLDQVRVTRRSGDVRLPGPKLVLNKEESSE
jgi:selenocysteine-specific elongation factor